jgi:hypothetical protein
MIAVNARADKTFRVFIYRRLIWVRDGAQCDAPISDRMMV